MMMTSEPTSLRPLRGDLVARLRRFARAEDGMVTIFACFMILMMLLIGGIGADMMRHEMERTRIQAVADRAVLAAADRDQKLDPESVVRDYFAKSGMADFVSHVDVQQGLNYKIVSVDAETTINTQFMDALGTETLRVPAFATAEERVNKVEISLVLDISGSMRNNNKMLNLQTAATEFVDTLLTTGNKNLISISVVPYSEQVNIGPAIFNQLNINPVNPKHPYSHCVEIQDNEYGSTSLNLSRNYFQMQHFQWNYYSIESGNQLNTIYDTVCPQYGDPNSTEKNNPNGDDYEAVRAISQDAAAIKDQIWKLKPRAGTSIFLGMKWGVALLDPGTRGIVSRLSGMGLVDNVFASRPASYNDAETMKTVVLMTDGQNDRSFRITQPYYNSKSDMNHWADYNFQYYLNRFVGSRHHYKWYEQKYTAEQGDGFLESICNAAKAKRIIIWAIGFEVTDHGANVMRNCASSPSHFFRVEGIQISDAFNSIARQINQLRLTQ